jgi:type I site-specific restriction endonuclease
MEPYWHPVRFEQVIGRAVRICSHEHLPEEEQKVIVYIYLMKFLQNHLTSNPEEKEEGAKKPLVSSLIMKSDRSKDKKRVITSDEKLYEISNIKKKINASILQAIKETSIDCKVHKKDGDNLQCFSINSPNLHEYTYNPNHMKDAPSQQEEVELTLYPITDKNDPTIKYYLKKYDDNSSKMTGVLYNYKAYKNNKTLIEVGETGR